MPIWEKRGWKYVIVPQKNFNFQGLSDNTTNLYLLRQLVKRVIHDHSNMDIFFNAYNVGREYGITIAAYKITKNNVIYACTLRSTILYLHDIFS